MDVEQAVVIETYSDESFAEAAVSFLEAEGIESMILSDDAGHSFPNLDFAGGVRVVVAPGDAERAKSLLEQAAEKGDD
jgi:predicted Fe-Mo cluster-binding NifX family protein